MRLPIALLIFMAIVLVVAVVGDLDGSSDLELKSQNGYVVITNRGNAPIRVTAITINDRKDCAPQFGLFGIGTFQPFDLKVGDQALMTSNCNIVRMTITTPRNSLSYTF